MCHGGRLPLTFWQGVARRTTCFWTWIDCSRPKWLKVKTQIRELLPKHLKPVWFIAYNQWIDIDTLLSTKSTVYSDNLRFDLMSFCSVSGFSLGGHVIFGHHASLCSSRRFLTLDLFSFPWQFWGCFAGCPSLGISLMFCSCLHWGYELLGRREKHHFHHISRIHTINKF